ncbi:cation transporter [Pseudomonas chengduensis]|jgi:copper chaperone|uniref:Copper chaperone n=1 Tax=Ectopseudomonas chengduensis TaxID=489632 RepID=A0A1G6RKE6_9GAMM|nr:MULTISPECIES: cation transporter [Pseudomonas]KQO44071.1 copper resistance protein CopZ [Pseudomonas sp. Leaf83]MBP3062533.1 copper resistance protein CopZ [Pseudomonas chengduensis]MDH0957961.1 cation transporter [Pseudomonas chengduensis]MDH1535951.1 cation transporter [Pseudomonas chengduensis]MDH1624377.1 cation transporter [Pseudomonas chengduensis]
MKQFKVGGMSCGHCVRAVTQAIQALEQTARVEVDLAAGLVRVEGSLDASQIQAAIREEGYEVAPA